MKLDGVQSLPLEFNSYTETVISMLRDRSSGLTDAKLLNKAPPEHVHRAKHAAAAQGYKDIAVPGFFKWLQENLDKEDLQPWLTFEVMGKTSMKGVRPRRAAAAARGTNMPL
ncbi:unnamed protein product [Ectocarpus sp. CCAP 1310/34]|nr:unnamed protein product [Ectocarpus sp. CCAP 1310/34]